MTILEEAYKVIKAFHHYPSKEYALNTTGLTENEIEMLNIIVDLLDIIERIKK